MKCTRYSLPCTIAAMFPIRSRERERRHYAFGSALIAPRSHSPSLPDDEASQSAIITPFVRGAFSPDREEEEEDHGWEEWISDDRGKHLFGIIGMRRTRRERFPHSSNMRRRRQRSDREVLALNIKGSSRKMPRACRAFLGEFPPLQR